jgi:hypothetical protein
MEFPGRVETLAPTAGGDPSAASWEQVAERVADYLRALGVQDPLHIERLGARIRPRWDARVNTTPQEDPVEAAIEETCALLDAWLCTELGIAGDRATLFAARAAVLSGAVPNWTARFAGVSGDSLAAVIHAASVQAVPESAPLSMEPSTIDLFGHRLARRIVAAFRVLIGSQPTPERTADQIKLGQPQ